MDRGPSCRAVPDVPGDATLAGDPSELKLAAMTEATARALRRRGVTELEATLAAHSAITVFHVAFARWVSTADPLAFATCVADAGTALRALI